MFSTHLERTKRMIMVAAIALAIVGLPTSCSHEAIETRFKQACLAGNTNGVVKLIREGFDPNKRLPFNASVTPLSLAIQNGQKSVALTLLQQGAKPQQLDDKGYGSLYYALEYGLSRKADVSDLIRALLAHGSDLGEFGVNTTVSVLQLDNPNRLCIENFPGISK